MDRSREKLASGSIQRNESPAQEVNDLIRFLTDLANNNLWIREEEMGNQKSEFSSDRSGLICLFALSDLDVPVQ